MSPRRRPDDVEEEETPKEEKDPSLGQYVVVVGEQPVFSSDNKEACEAKAAQLRQDKIRANESIELPEHTVKVGQVKFAHKDDRTGKVEFEEKAKTEEE
jgi:hypothetical protein